MSRIQWAYGVTTVPARANDLLPRTLLSLRHAGFPDPHLFVDGCTLDEERGYISRHRTIVTGHRTALGVVGNWILALWELNIRHPQAHRYALFQDDVVFSRNIRDYLDRLPDPAQGYWNLLTFPSNEGLITDDLPTGFYHSRETNPGSGCQTGRGAVALVFTQEAVAALLGHADLVNRPRCSHSPTRRVDGLIVTCMNKLGYKELVHNPSLCLHTGKESTCGNRPHPSSKTFRGEEYDCLQLLESISTHPLIPDHVCSTAC